MVKFVLFVQDWGVFKEAPFVSNCHFGDVGQNEILFLAGVIEDAAKVDSCGKYLEVGKADLTLKKDSVLVRMTIMGDCHLAVYVVAHTILLHTWIEFNLHSVTSILFKHNLLDRATKGWVNLQPNRCDKRARILDSKVSRDRHRWNALFPQILEIKLRIVKLQRWRNKVACNVHEVDRFGLSLISSQNLALPLLSNPVDLRRVGADFNHDAHLSVQSNLVWDDCENLDLIWFFFSQLRLG